MITKDSVKKDDKEEEKPDMRSKYAMINLIKNKLRAAGQRDPMVMAVDACEENLLEKGMGPNARQIQIDKLKRRKEGEPQEVKGSEPEKPDTPIPPKPSPKPDTAPEPEKKPESPRTGKPSPRKPPKPPKPPKQPYNPYGTGTANPENMAPGRP